MVIDILLDNNRIMATGDKYGRVWRLVRNAVRNEICKAAGILKRVGKVTVQFLDSRVVSWHRPLLDCDSHTSWRDDINLEPCVH